MPKPITKAPIHARLDSFVWNEWFNNVSNNFTPFGWYVPKMTTTERDAITNPQAGQLIYNTTTNKLNVYTTAWEQVTSV